MLKRYTTQRDGETQAECATRNLDGLNHFMHPTNVKFFKTRVGHAEQYLDGALLGVVASNVMGREGRVITAYVFGPDGHRLFTKDVNAYIYGVNAIRDFADDIARTTAISDAYDRELAALNEQYSNLLYKKEV